MGAVDRGPDERHVGVRVAVDRARPPGWSSALPSSAPVVPSASVQRTGPDQSSPSSSMKRRSQISSKRRRLGRARLSCHTEVIVAVTPSAQRSTALTLSSMPSWPWKFVEVGVHDLHLAGERAQRVDVVDRVLEQCAGTGELAATSANSTRSGLASG